MSSTAAAAVLAAPFVGSFLATLAARLPARRETVFARSQCPACARNLAPRDLVPVLSWAMNRGQCRYCAAPIDKSYLLMELAAVGVAVWAVVALEGAYILAGCALGWTLLTLAVIDIRHFTLPDALTVPLLALGLLLAALRGWPAFLDAGIGAAAGFAVFAAVGWVHWRLRSREGLGLGDAKLLAAAGAWVAWSGLASVVLVASLAALASAAARILLHGRDTPAPIAFGPYLGIATWLIVLYGPLV
ncbi:MAG: prepilin peptidase [Rhodospirillales bacterium]|nr:prepilin peptidase [Rhodospirillales bacterium]